MYRWCWWGRRFACRRPSEARRVRALRGTRTRAGESPAPPSTGLKYEAVFMKWSTKQSRFHRMPPPVFISYSRGASAPHAQALAAGLGDLAFLDTAAIDDGDPEGPSRRATRQRRRRRGDIRFEPITPGGERIAPVAVPSDIGGPSIEPVNGDESAIKRNIAHRRCGPNHWRPEYARR